MVEFVLGMAENATVLLMDQKCHVVIEKLYSINYKYFSPQIPQVPAHSDHISSKLLNSLCHDCFNWQTFNFVMNNCILKLNGYYCLHYNG